jgi:hypothetical protein
MRPSEIEFSVIAGRQPVGVRREGDVLRGAAGQGAAVPAKVVPGTNQIRRFPVIGTEGGVGDAVMRLCLL